MNLFFTHDFSDHLKVTYVFYIFAIFAIWYLKYFDISNKSVSSSRQGKFRKYQKEALYTKTKIFGQLIVSILKRHHRIVAWFYLAFKRGSIITKRIRSRLSKSHLLRIFVIIKIFRISLGILETFMALPSAVYLCS